MNANMDIKKYGISLSSSAGSSESPIVELNGWSHIVVSGHQKEMKYVSNRFFQVY
jgi:hypothetical protein